jgi:thioredoxin reductase (NADPH)
MTLDFTLSTETAANDLLTPSARYDVVVIGGGPSGATAALYSARAGLDTLVIDKGLTAGALGLTPKIANYPGILGEVSGAELVALIRQQAESFGAIFLQDKVQAVELDRDDKAIYANNGTFYAPVVIIATGSMGRGRRVEGEERLLGRGVSYCATCDGAFFQDQDVAVVGNDDEALEAALYLTRFARRIHLISPTTELKSTAGPQAAVIGHSKIELILGASLREVHGEAHVESVLVVPRGEGARSIAVSGAFIFLQGNLPVTDFLQGQINDGPAECMRVDREFHTQLPGVFAVGDVLCDHVKQAVVAAAEGAVAAIAAEKQLHGRRQLSVDWAK